MVDRKNSEFIIALDGIKLDAKQEAALAADLQAVAMKHLAAIDLAPEWYFRIPNRRWWCGLYIRKIKDLVQPDQLQIPTFDAVPGKLIQG